MTQYSVQNRDWIFVKGYECLSFKKTKTMSKNVGKNISKSLSGKYSQKLIDHVKQSATDAFKTSSKGVIQKPAEVIWLVINFLNQYLDYLNDPSFQELNKLFVSSFEDEAQRTSYKRHYLPTVEIKNYNIMIAGQNFFDKPVRNVLITYDIQKITTIQEDNYIYGCLLDYNYFKNYYKIE